MKLSPLVNLILSFLPERYKAYATLGMSLFRHLETSEQRIDAVNYLQDSLESDGYISVIEWAKFGKMTGIVGKAKG